MNAEATPLPRDRLGSPAATYFWQVVASVSSAAIIGLFFWLWNVTLDIRELQNTRTDIGRLAADQASARALIDRNSDRLVKIEAQLDQEKERHATINTAILTLASEIKQANDMVNSNGNSMTRLTEIIRQLERGLQAHFSDDGQPSYRPGPPPQGEP